LNQLYTFRKEERLSSKKEIELLFNEGAAFYANPFRIIYLKKEESASFGASILISVPKRRFKRAVKRNRVKRLVREAYRLNNSNLKILLDEKATKLLIAFIFVGIEVPNYDLVEQSVQKAINELINRLQCVEQ